MEIRDDKGAHDGREVIVTPPTEIDIATADLFGELLDQACALGPDRVIVDFASVTFCDSTGLKALVHAQRKLGTRGCSLVVRNPPASVRRVTAILGMSDELGIPRLP